MELCGLGTGIGTEEQKGLGSLIKMREALGDVVVVLQCQKKTV
jgi:hypothetical protein